VLADHVLLSVGDVRYHTKLEAEINVKRCHYLGPLPVKMVGYRDEQNGSITAQELKTDFIDFARIERGEVPGWVQLSADKEIAIEVILEIGYVDSLPESSEDMVRKDTTG
jgi:hypothetical protein